MLGTTGLLPILNLNRITDSLCQNGSEITLSATPSGGTWAGTGVANGKFSPQTSGVGSYWISYSFTDIKGCLGRDSMKINVRNCRVNVQNTLESEGISITIFPNPSFGKDVYCTIKTTKSERITLEEYDLAGKSLGILLKNTMVLDEKTVLIPASSQLGMTLLKITIGEKIFYQKLMR